MLDLAISIDTDPTIIETNNGVQLRAPDWPHDCEFQLIAFDPSQDSCEVVLAEGLAEDISSALAALGETALLKVERKDWYRRLAFYARGADKTRSEV